MKFDNLTGLIPAIIQDDKTNVVLMLGYMNQESFEITKSTGRVTFWSRSKERLWTKGESSGHYLILKSWKPDCDEDTLLIKVSPQGPTCHKGTDTCWGEDNDEPDIAFIDHLQGIIKERYDNRSDQSYTSSLFDKGTNKIAQKVGEEATELIIEAKDDNDELFVNEAADLLFHYLVLLRDRGMGMKEVIDVLKERHK